MRAGRVLLLIGAVAFTACGEDLLAPDDLIGSYGLATVSGQSLPFVLHANRSDGSCILAGESGRATLRVNNGSLELEASRFDLRIALLRTCTYAATTTNALTMLRAFGTWALDGDRLVLQAESTFDTELSASVESSDAIRMSGALFADEGQRHLRFTRFE